MDVQLLDSTQTKLFFQVMIQYEDCDATADIPEDERQMESAAIGDLDEAEEIAKHAIHKIHTKFPQTAVVELELDQTDDGYHLLLVDGTGSKVAKVGVAYTNYSNETIH